MPEYMTCQHLFSFCFCFYTWNYVSVYIQKLSHYVSCLKLLVQKGFKRSPVKDMPVLNHTVRNYTDNTKTKNISMYFNISEMRRSVGDYRLLTSAELRMLIKQTTIPTEQRVELYQGLGLSARYLTSRFITNQWKDKWLSFDVTESLQNWLKGTGEIKQILCVYLVLR